MIRSIFIERYKKALIAACLLVIGLSVCTALVQNNQWKNLYNNPPSRIDFELNRNEYTYYDEGEMDFVPYKSYKEYRDATRLFYNVYSGYSDFSIKTMSKAENYSNRIPYSSSVGHFYIGLSLLTKKQASINFSFLCHFRGKTYLRAKLSMLLFLFYSRYSLVNHSMRV